MPDHAARPGGPTVANDHQRETYLLPTVEGRREECYAITEEYAGSDVSDLQATAARDGDDYVLNGVKWHVTSYNKADYVLLPGRADHRRARRRAGAVRRRQGHTRASGWSAPRRTPTPSPTTTRSWRSRTSGCPATHLIGSEDAGMSFVYEWFRFERLMIGARCLGAAERLVDEMTAFAAQRADRRRAARRQAARAGACSPTA